MRRIRAFTLIELLVVIAVIALLIGLLFPALKQARERARTVVCRSNIRQLSIAMFTYATDFGQIPGAYWEGGINLDWCGKNNVRYWQNPDEWLHPMETSPLYKYVSEDEDILGCPTAQREANLLYDYTMIIRMAGARTDLIWRMSYPLRPESYNSEREYFHALPLLVEENRYWYNSQNDDGSFANRDQWSTRHQGESAVSYLDGSAGPFAPPNGGIEELQQPEDMETRDLRLHVGSRTYSVWYGEAGQYGWVNNPR